MKIPFFRKIKYWLQWRTNWLFFSEKQKQLAGSCFAKTVFGNEVEYTEMRSFASHKLGKSNWQDFKLVGFGQFIRKGAKSKLRYQ